MLKNQEHSVCQDGTIRANGLKGHSPVTRIERVTGLLISHAQLGRLRLNVAYATSLIGRGFTEFFGKEAEFSKTYPELADWAQALLQNFENECFSMMEATSGLYGVEFSSSENFKEEFVARIVQLAIGRYGLAPITFFAAYNGVDEDFDSNYGHIYKVSAEKIELISTIDLIQAHKDRLKETDLLACMNDSSRDFKAFYRSKDWGEAGEGSLKRAALKLAARNDQKENFSFLLEEGVPADDPGLLRLLESRPEMKAMVEARKISEEVMEGGAAKTRKTSISRMSAA